MRVEIFARAGAVLGVCLAVACSGSNTPTSPSAQSQSPIVLVVTLTGAVSAVGTSSQFQAIATLSNGTTQTVTADASWQSTNPSVASVGPSSGIVTAVAAGEADIVATYHSVSGRSHVIISAPAKPLAVSGTVTDGTSGGILPNIRIQVMDGPSAGQAVNTGATGTYTLTGLAAGTFTLSASAVSYQTTTKTITATSDTRVDFVLPRAGPPQGRLAFSTTASQGWTSIDVSVGGRVVGTLRRFFEPGGATSCDAVADARVVATVDAGVPIAWSARSDRGVTWSGSQTVPANGCFEVQLTCTDRNCAAPAPPPTPTPTPSPGPPLSSGLYVWGGPNYTQYLGVFTCVFCTEFGAESINNQFGNYGSQFSSTSIRNQFSQYGSQFSTYSACNQFASTPPRVYNANRSVYYGELTINQFRSEGIKAASIVNWLNGDVCRH